MLESWIDALTRVMAVSDGQGGQVKSYLLYEKAEFPQAITVTPCALTYVVGYKPLYSLKGPKTGFYRGMTEYHLTTDLNRARIPEILRYYARIRNAVAGAIALGNRADIEHFGPRPDLPDFIEGPLELRYGSEDPHLGLRVHWEVKANENDDADYTPAA